MINNSTPKPKLIYLLGIWLITVVIWGWYRINFVSPEWIEELFLKPLVFIGPVLLYLNFKEKITREALGLIDFGKFRIWIWGGVFGTTLVFINILIQVSRRQLTFSLGDQAIFLAVFISLATAVSEEILYRGFLLKRILQLWQKEDLTNFFISVLFSLGHVSVALFNLQYKGSDLWGYLILIFVIGFTQGYVYLRTGSIYASIAAHALWNFGNLFVK